jgi:hypothetical protein
MGPNRSLWGDEGGPLSLSDRSPANDENDEGDEGDVGDVDVGDAGDAGDVGGAGVGLRIGVANGGGVASRFSPGRSPLPAAGLGGRGVVETSGVRAPPSGPRDSLATRLLSAKKSPSSTAD